MKDILEPNWVGLLKSWDEQQDDCIPNRQAKFDAILDILSAYLPSSFSALDLGSGPGSLSLRLLRKFPGVSVVAVDFDPVLLKIGQEALSQYGSRIRWVDADIGSIGWRNHLPRNKFDAVVSSTAIHWMDRLRLRRLYEDLAKILRRGGIFLNGDVMPRGRDKRKLDEISERIRYSRHGTLEVEFAPWHEWWKKLEREQTGLAPKFRERKERFSQGQTPEGMLPVEFHAKMLKRVGFSEIDTIWQNLLQDRVLAAIR